MRMVFTSFSRVAAGRSSDDRGRRPAAGALHRKNYLIAA
jgi:hypothetical protein